MTTGWFVVQTQANRESFAAAALERQGFAVFLPRFAKRVSHARRVSIVHRPLFPGYLFVGLGQDSRWRAINGTSGVVRLVTAGDAPLPIAAGIVEAMIAQADAGGVVALRPRRTFQPGDPVRIVGGSLADTLGLFEDVKCRQRISILLDILGRKVRVVLVEEQVEQAA
jgi:transcriptional antiterminator RfaH